MNIIISISYAIILIVIGILKHNTDTPLLIISAGMMLLLCIDLFKITKDRDFRINEMSKMYGLLVSKNKELYLLEKANNDIHDYYEKSIDEYKTKKEKKTRNMSKNEIKRRNDKKIKHYSEIYSIIKEDLDNGLSKNKIIKKYKISIHTLNNVLEYFKK